MSNCDPLLGLTSNWIEYMRLFLIRCLCYSTFCSIFRYRTTWDRFRYKHIHPYFVAKQVGTLGRSRYETKRPKRAKQAKYPRIAKIFRTHYIYIYINICVCACVRVFIYLYILYTYELERRWKKGPHRAPHQQADDALTWCVSWGWAHTQTSRQVRTHFCSPLGYTAVDSGDSVNS